MCVTVTVVTGHSVALSRRSHLFSTMSSLHDVLMHESGIGPYTCGELQNFYWGPNSNFPNIYI
jgi:hypothetical protein